MKNPFKRKKNQIPKPVEPRAKEDIQKDIDDTVNKLGYAEYHIYVQKQNSKVLNARCVQLAKEMQARQALDQKAEPKEEKGTSDVQS